MANVNVGNVESQLIVKDGFSAIFQAAVTAAQSAGKAMSDGLGGAAKDITSNLDDLKSKAGDIGDGLKQIFTDPVAGVEQLASSIGGTLQTALAAIGPAGEGAAVGMGALIAAGTAVAATVFTLADHAASAGEEVENFSIKTGIAVENVGQLQFAAQVAGGSLDTISSILQHMTLKESAGDGTKFAAALKDIGVNADIFAKQDNETRLLEIAKGFQQGSKSGNDMKDAIALMGRAGAENLPFLTKLTDDAMAAGARLGVQWTQDSVEASKQFKIGLNTIETALGGIATRIGLAVLPAMTDLVTQIATSPQFFNLVTGAVELLSHGLGYLVEGFGSVVSAGLELRAQFAGMSASSVQFALDLEGSVKNALQALSYLPGAGGAAAVAISALDATMKNQSATLAGLNATYDKYHGYANTAAEVTDKIGQALVNVHVPTQAQIEANLALNKTHEDGGASADKFAKAVQGIVDSLEGDSKKTLETKAAIDQVIASGNQDVDVKTRVEAAIEKLIKAHVTLTATEQTYYTQNLSLTTESQKGVETLAKLKNDYYTLVQKGEGSSLAAQLAANQAWYNSEKDKLDKTKAYNDQYYATLDQLRLNKDAKDDDSRQKALIKDQKFADDTGKIWNDYYAQLDKDDNDTLATKLQNVDTWYQNETDKIDQLLNSGQISWVQYYARLVALDADANAKRIKALDDYAAAVAKREQDIADLEDQINKIRLERSGNTVAAQIADIQRWYDDLVTKHQKAKDEDQAYYDNLAILAQEKINDVIHASDPLWAAWKNANADMRQDYANTWEAVLDGTKSWKDAMMQPINDLRDGWKKVLAAMLADWEQQLFNPLLQLSHQLMGSLMSMLSGGLLGGGGAGGGVMNLAGGGLLSGLLGGGGGAAAGAALPGTAISALTLPGEAAGQIAIGGGAAGGGAGGGGLLSGIGLGGLGTVAAGAGGAAAGFGTGYLLSNAFGKTAGTIGGGLGGAAEGALIGSIVPGIGTAIGALIGGLSGVIGGLFGGGNKDRGTVVDWVGQNFGKTSSGGANFDAFHATLNQMSDQMKSLGISSEQLWINLTQGKEPAQKAIQDVIDAFQKVQQAQAATAASSDTSTSQQISNQAAVVQSIQGQIDALDQQQQKIELSGDTTSDVAQKQIAAIAATKKELVSQMADAATALAASASSAQSAIQQIFAKPISVKYEYDPTNSLPAPGGGGGGAGYGGAQAEGGDYVVDKPTWFLAGEAGTEAVSFSGAYGRRNQGQPVTIQATVVSMMDGHEVARSLSPHMIQVMPGDLMRALGISGLKGAS